MSGECLLIAPPKATAQLLSLQGHTLNILWHKTTYDQSYATVVMRSLLSILRVYSPMCSYISRARERIRYNGPIQEARGLRDRYTLRLLSAGMAAKRS